MSKTKKKISKKASTRNAETVDADKPKPVEQTETEERDGFDFGGLPQRDLKKNLGCG